MIQKMILGNKFVFFFSYLFLIGSITVFSSKVFFPNYNLLDLSNLFIGLVGSITTIASLIGISWVVRRFFSEDLNTIKAVLQRFQRRGYFTLFNLIAGSIFFLLFAFIPAKDPVMDLLSLAKYTSNDDLVRARLVDLEKFDKFKSDPRVKMLDKTMEFRKSAPLWQISDYESFVNEAAALDLVKYPLFLFWKKYLIAECKMRLGLFSDCLNLLSDIKDHSKDSFLVGRSYKLQGNIFSDEDTLDVVHDTLQGLALQSWLTSASFFPYFDVYMNIAFIYENEKKFDTALHYYNLADSLITLDKAKLQIDLKQEAMFRVNKAVYYKLVAKACKCDSSEKRKLIDSAIGSIEMARKVDPAYCDAYWTGVNICIEFRDYDLGEAILAQCLRVLNNPEVFGLDRYREFNYQNFGKQYCYWLTLYLKFSEDRSKVDSSMKVDIRNNIPGIATEPYKTVSDLLSFIQSKGIIVGDDIAVLDQMKDAHFLEGLRSL